MDVRPRGLPLQGTIRPSVPWCFPVQEAGQQHQQQPKPAHQKQRSGNNRSSSPQCHGVFLSGRCVFLRQFVS